MKTDLIPEVINTSDNIYEVVDNQRFSFLTPTKNKTPYRGVSLLLNYPESSPIQTLGGRRCETACTANKRTVAISGFVTDAHGRSVTSVVKPRLEKAPAPIASIESNWIECVGAFASRGSFRNQVTSISRSEKNWLGKRSGTCTKRSRWRRAASFFSSMRFGAGSVKWKSQDKKKDQKSAKQPNFYPLHSAPKWDRFNDALPPLTSGGGASVFSVQSGSEAFVHPESILRKHESNSFVHLEAGAIRASRSWLHNARIVHSCISKLGFVHFEADFRATRILLITLLSLLYAFLSNTRARGWG